jgi:hypothetical protein
VYFIYKQFKGAGGKRDIEDPVKDPVKEPIIKRNTPDNVVVPPTPSYYPLKKGSFNNAVESLQMLLNSMGQTLVVDKHFGSKTEAALLAVFGKTQVADAAEFTKLQNEAVAKQLKSSSVNWGWKLVDAYKGFSSGNRLALKNLVVKSPIKIIEIKKNFQGAWKNTGKVKDMPAINYSLNDYAIRSAMNDGTLRIEILKGADKGMYSTEVGKDLSLYLDII